MPDIFLWNPATRKCKKLPAQPTDFLRPFHLNWSSQLCGFGYDGVNDDYKVLRIFQPSGDHDLSGSKAMVYGLKTNSWKRLENISNHFRFVEAWGVFMCGALHWITFKPLERCVVILAFDLGVETYREVPFPNVEHTYTNQLSLSIFAGFLCLLEYNPFVRIDVWVMNDYGVGNSWGKLFSLDHPKIIRSCMGLRPNIYSQNHSDVLLEFDNKMIWYNLEKKKVKTLKVANLPDRFNLDAYTQSLVSPESNVSCDEKHLPNHQQRKKKKQEERKKNNRFLKGFARRRRYASVAGIADLRLQMFSMNSLHQSQTTNATVYFVEDLLAQILDRLPVKILLRIRSVCKPWCSLIDSPRFVKAHLKRSIECKTNTGVIIRGFLAYSVDFDSLDDTTAIEISEPLRTLLRGTGLVGSCNGLLCLYQRKTDIYLWNPATRKCKELPTAPTDFIRPFDIDPSFLCGFGYDAVNDDYKVLRILHPDRRDLAGSKVIVYSLKSNSWKRLQDISNHFILVRYWGIFMGGALHWITVKTLGSESCLSILAFDLATENCREVPMPAVQYKNPNKLSLCIFAESLCVLILYPSIRMDVWSMKEYGIGNSWCKLFSLEHTQLVSSSISVRPVAYSKCRSDVLVEVVDKKVMWYNLERKTIRTVNIANMPDVFHDLEVYTESLVPPDYIFSCNGEQQQEKKKQPQQQRRKERDGFLSKGFKLVL
ncbi:hypothetical protein POM88_042728 [Heracleum sosnowskyi]|uniref:F-box domain-containing protein n=1 Tax=Heracleum sosnowskyi TaxID=360622 RepID=A0AAD8HJ57_9APIA|nr:hypothetical protein POM88_042728 [Heracleum sosnowskyi]